MFVANPVLGRISDTLGRLPVLLLSLGDGTVAHLWFAVSNDMMQMFAVRTIAGLAAGNMGVIQSIIADEHYYKPEPERWVLWERQLAQDL